MAQRGVSEEQVEEAIQRPDRRRPARRPRAARYEKQISLSRRLCVILDVERDVFRIVSVFWIT